MIKTIADLNAANEAFWRPVKTADDAGFEEGKHPRDPDGQFGSGGGGKTSAPAAAANKKQPRKSGATLTKAAAYAAGQDAGNRSAKAGNRTEWNEDDWNAAAEVTAKLLGQLRGE